MLLFAGDALNPAISAKFASYACTSEPIARPNAVRASDALLDPVPPCATATSVAAHDPVPIAPTVVIALSPVYELPATAANVA